MEQSEESRSVEVKYTESDDYELLPATSVSGGIQPSGQFLFDFITEYTVRTGSEDRALTDTGVGDIIDDRSELIIRQQRQVGVTMSQAAAFRSACWAIANILGGDVEQGEIKALIKNEYADQFE